MLDRDRPIRMLELLGDRLRLLEPFPDDRMEPLWPRVSLDLLPFLRGI